MKQAKKGDSVKVHYTGKLEDGTVFDSSANQDPMAFTIGNGELIPGFEEAVVGMQEGESKQQKIVAGQAYGLHRDELMVKVDRKTMPADLNVNVGQHLKVTHPDGRTNSVTVASVSDEAVILDANHPLAGKDLVFEIELVEIVAA